MFFANTACLISAIFFPVNIVWLPDPVGLPAEYNNPLYPAWGRSP